jgi:putative ABC transport system permease protein
LFITLFIKNELSYDSFHKKSDRIYRFTTVNPKFLGGKHFARTHNVKYIPDLADYFPEVENYIRLAPIFGDIKYEQNYIKTNQFFICDSTFFDVFDTELLTGDPNTILNAPGSLVVSENFAKRVFGNKNPVGQELSIPTSQFQESTEYFTVNGVMKEFPQNSHFHPEIIISSSDPDKFKNWAFTYLLLSENANPENITSGFKDFYAKRAGKNTDEVDLDAHLQKLPDIHLRSNKLREIESNSDISKIYVFVIAAIILLLISLSNYANLNIGMAGFSTKYLYINKILGSSNLISLKYFIVEGFIITLLSIVIAFFISVIASSIIQKYFSMNLIAGNVASIIVVIAVFSTLNIFAGILPVLSRVISQLRLKSTYKERLGQKTKEMSKSLIVVQFAFSIILIVSVLIISRQTDFLLKNSLGNQSGNIISIEPVGGKLQLFKEEILKYSSIESVSAMFEEFGGETNDMFRFNLEGYKVDAQYKDFDRIGVFPCDYSFATFFGLNFLSGENFSEKIEDNEGSGEYIINEAAMKRLRYHYPNEIVGKDFQIISNYKEIPIPRGKIIGVVEDFHLSSMKKEVVPLVLFKRKEIWLFSTLISFKPGMQKAAIADIQKVWEELYPGYLFKYEHVGAMYDKVYRTELLQTKLLSIFTFIAIFICSMGLLGLSLLVAQNRIKEIGVRKVNGAKISEILTMLNREFIKWITIAFIIAVPIGYYAMNKWLEGFAYKTELSWWIFILAGMLALGIALLTVSWQSWKAATRNPVEALRYE